MTDEEKSQLQFLPFHAINEFMRIDFRMTVLRSALLSVDEVSDKTRSEVDRLTKKWVKVPGFRNSAKAPATMKAVSMVKPFENEPKMAGAILQAWTETHPELRQQIFEILNRFGWKQLPPEFNRIRLPGFLTQWPEEEDYEVIYAAYAEKYPEGEHGIDEVSLMAVWLSMRLPVDKVSKTELAELPFPDISEEESES